MVSALTVVNCPKTCRSPINVFACNQPIFIRSYWELKEWREYFSSAKFIPKTPVTLSELFCEFPYRILAHLAPGTAEGRPATPVLGSIQRQRSFIQLAPPPSLALQNDVLTIRLLSTEVWHRAQPPSLPSVHSWVFELGRLATWQMNRPTFVWIGKVLSLLL
jgi:hypothetical protein